MVMLKKYQCFTLFNYFHLSFLKKNIRVLEPQTLYLLKRVFSKVQFISNIWFEATEWRHQTISSRSIPRLFFLDQNFQDRDGDFFFETKYFRDQYRDFFLRPNVFETDSRLFWDQMFSRLIPRLFWDQIFSRLIPRLLQKLKSKMAA